MEKQEAKVSDVMNLVQVLEKAGYMVMKISKTEPFPYGMETHNDFFKIEIEKAVQEHS